MTLPPALKRPTWWCATGTVLMVLGCVGFILWAGGTGAAVSGASRTPDERWVLSAVGLIGLGLAVVTVALLTMLWGKVQSVLHRKDSQG